jgi:hypothetical protein
MKQDDDFDSFAAKLGIVTPTTKELRILRKIHNIALHLKKNPEERAPLAKALLEIRGVTVRLHAPDIMQCALMASMHETPKGMRRADRAAKELLIDILEAALDSSRNGD